VTEEQRRQHAFDVAWRALAQRDRTQSELQRILAGKRVDPALIGEVCGELEASGYLDDAAYARRFAEDRRNLDGWGAERIERRLRALGIAAEHVAAALAQRTGDEELAAAVSLLERRFPSPPQTARDRDRALGALLRKGYELELAHDALRRYAGAPAVD
jgi:regulatory protein